MNFSKNLSFTFPQNTAFSLLNYFFGLFYFVSFLGKVLDYESWFEFHFGILHHWIGYVNGLIILVLELYFSVRFLLGRVDRSFLDFNLIFIGILTLVVAIFPDLFRETCLCFGRFFEFTAGLGFFAKNILLLILLFLHKLLLARKEAANNF